jgi:Alpha-glutamyl/putrescinyl thymine pyrophosphorylase clade 3
VRPGDAREAQRLRKALKAYERDFASLPGIAPAACRQVFLEQLVESERRVRYVRYFVQARIAPTRTDPFSGQFDPLKAAILQHRDGNLEEAYWMVFLFVHFGKHRTAGWRYSADTYSGLGNAHKWDWPHVSAGVPAFRDWLDENQATLRDPSRPHGFGNHRKYESLGAWSENGTGSVVASYVEWVSTLGTHRAHFEKAVSEAKGDRERAFNILFNSMRPIRRFGRTARFDYLSMVGKVGLAPIRPDHAYLVGSTGPLAGARLLFGPPAGNPSTASALHAKVIELEGYLNVGFDPLEDALCNWQKSPGVFKPFRG